MTNWLFAHGVVAVTAEMTVRFSHAIASNAPVVARARIARSQVPLDTVGAQVLQAQQVKAETTGKFVGRPIS